MTIRLLTRDIRELSQCPMWVQSSSLQSSSTVDWSWCCERQQLIVDFAMRKAVCSVADMQRLPYQQHRKGGSSSPFPRHHPRARSSKSRRYHHLETCLRCFARIWTVPITWHNANESVVDSVDNGSSLAVCALVFSSDLNPYLLL